MAEVFKISPKSKTSKYQYVALNTDESIVKGTISASSDAEAASILAEKGLKTASLELVPSRFALEQMLPSLFAIKPKEVIIFSRQLATLMESGVSLLPALELLQGQASTSKGFRRIINVIVNDLRAGKSFSESIEKHDKVFNQIYQRTLAVGERTGKMETTLRQLAEFQEKSGAMAKKLSGALTYPIIVIGIAFFITIFLVTVALPPMIDMFENMKADLPITTRMLVGLTDFIGAYKFPVFLVFISVAVVGIWYSRQPSGRLFFDRMRIKAPLLGPALHMGELGRISRTMTVLLDSGVPLQEIMEILPQTTSNSLVRQSLSKVHQSLLLGEGLSQQMSRDPLFPPLMVQMVTVGEESNSLVPALTVVSNFYEETAEDKLKALVGMITPISTIFIALIVGFIAMSVVMPIYQITGSF
ncbi:type II secretion system F family protein [Chloroflexota bacterium]